MNLHKELEKLQEERKELDDMIAGIRALIRRGWKGTGTRSPVKRAKATRKSLRKAKRVYTRKAGKPVAKRPRFQAAHHILRILTDGNPRTSLEFVELFNSMGINTSLSNAKLRQIIGGALTAMVRHRQIRKFSDGRYGLELTKPVEVKESVSL